MEGGLLGTSGGGRREGAGGQGVGGGGGCVPVERLCAGGPGIKDADRGGVGWCSSQAAVCGGPRH